MDNLQSYIRKHIHLAEHFEQLLLSDSRFEVKEQGNNSVLETIILFVNYNLKTQCIFVSKSF